MIDYTKRMAVAAMLAAAMLAPSGFAALADDTKADAQALVDKATVTVKNFSSDPDMTWFRDNAPKAKGLLFVPRVIRGGLILGGTGGTGVLLARDGNGGDWSDPAFYTVGSVTIGLQIGGEVSELVLIVMSQKGMDALLSTDLKLGGDASVAAGPVGAGAKAQTADVISFSRTKGAFAGVNLEGAVVAVRDSLNAAYYGGGTRPVDILVSRKVSNPGSAKLREAVGQISPR